ncbi:uncharacterized protein LDX57_010075 [Aspergillus melleus]|uniref:uncharacterized protein n=1 Tax=Aspergillus melleus TaxID=138277 RepID=UPI001E8CDBFF|nr:uncharacterized protein LDX57_010075 [Aspergillus melleus]KAH8432439.1 hypothetical protein LDX57_010075 [Aspergillus melleus]
MTACDHIVCLRHVENERTGEIVLEDTGRFWRVVQELPKPSLQTPQLALFIGTNAKDNALKHIYPQNNIEDGPHDSLKHDLLRKALQFHAVQLNNVFSAAQTFQLAGTYLSPLARYQRLQHEIRTQTQQMLELKQKSHMLLSAYHLASFFAKAVEKLAQSRSGEFNFFSESRRRNEIGTDYQRHIETFLAQAQRQRTSYDSIASFIATSILMDAYPPRMHRQWLPRLRDLSDPADPPRLSN